jgi:solute carrier family 25 iron transporter 28/37
VRERTLPCDTQPTPCPPVLEQHAAAGSAAGLAEHLVMYPVDTVKTVMQARQQQHCTLEHAVQRGGAAGSSSASAAACSCTHCATPLDVAVRLWRSQGGFRLWRGVQTTLTGCIPAHAVYFTMYEGLKPIFTKWLASLRVLPMLLGRSAASGPAGPSDSAQAMGAGAAVAVSTMAHDMIMTPMDVCKQRMQLSSSRCTVYDCARDIMKIEGPRAFYVSYPTTLLMNLPYALIMGTSNEALRKLLSPNGDPSYAAYLAAGKFHLFSLSDPHASGAHAIAGSKPTSRCRLQVLAPHPRSATLPTRRPRPTPSPPLLQVPAPAPPPRR